MSEFPTLFSPITIGRMSLRNRIYMPPHTATLRLFGAQSEADANMAYIKARAEAGVAWIDGITGHIDNRFPAGFEPVGIGARTKGYFRLPFTMDRLVPYAEAVHAAGAVSTVQLVSQGGLPNASSATLSTPMLNAIPHSLTREEIRWYVEEFAFAARQCQIAGHDGVEVHLNHDDLMEWFISPLVNHRDDEYGGNPENRMRFVVEILREIRELCGDDFTVGVRMNMFEESPGGYDLAGGLDIAQRLEATSMIDFLSVVVGSNWGNPSYIQSQHFAKAQWADLSKQFVEAVDLPIVYSGRVTDPVVAEQVLAKGQAHVVGMARAFVADPQLIVKAQSGRVNEITPCVGCNDCISATINEKLNLSCPVNPHVGYEGTVSWPLTPKTVKRLLVIGGGPTGLETAALAAECGHDVELWEASEHLGGQLRIATAAPDYGGWADFLAYQQDRLARLGVRVKCNMPADVNNVSTYGADVIAVATGSTPRRPEIAGVNQPNVLDSQQVLEGASVGHRVVIVSQDDHMGPLAVADYLSSRGHAVTVVYATAGPAPLLSRYFIGGIMAKLDAAGVEFRFLEQVRAIEPGIVRTMNVYSQLPKDIHDVDSVVLACGTVGNDGLFNELQRQGRPVTLLGDAYAPRRVLWGSKQAYAFVTSLAN